MPTTTTTTTTTTMHSSMGGSESSPAASGSAPLSPCLQAEECHGRFGTTPTRSPKRSRGREHQRRTMPFHQLSCPRGILLVVAAIDALCLFSALLSTDAFRMVRHSRECGFPARPSASATPHDERKNPFYSLCHETALFASPNSEANQQQATAAPMKDPFEATGQDNDLFKTLAGGPALIFEMARKSVLFATKEPDARDPPARNATTETRTATPAGQQSQSSPQGRWYPHSGIAGDNPNFRTQAPAMTNQGFARSIWKNARKRNKPSLWKHALRTYDRMALLEADPGFAQIERANVHHEGAMQACAKLGLWQRALEIYHFVHSEETGEGRQQQPQQQQQQQPQPRRTTGGGRNERTGVYVTDDMVLSLVRATVRASRLRSRRKRATGDPPPTPEEEEREAALRKIPLDSALEILSRLKEDHGLPLAAYYVNPLAAAYQSLGYTAHSKEILETMLSNRTAGEDDLPNVHDLCAKDKGSYSLLVQASVVRGDWGAAVDSLAEMTGAGLYPNPRHCNMWSEISERQTRPRAVGSWKKKRDDFWTDSIR
ncbi:unnamed protein product [Pseudo-nitzschia multistriata]|uniref:Pentacotripeptide-repeat region of PRORP domain-containing protein n=1 Tax=Pseudo-nitzschia multistriata TaxID=183589 RepID=A0A448ZGV3_9STRA|nr:unnamed protein product [Pseudo-nitzschia multistriata]